MVYIFIYSIAIVYLYTLDRVKKDKGAKLVIYFMVIVTVTILPALQYDVGTDYFTYVDVYNKERRLEVYYNKQEYLFYYLLETLKSFKYPEQSLFVFISLIQSVLIVNVFRIIKNSNTQLSLSLLFFLFIVVTNMQHNQMNLLRSYVAVYAFLNAFLYWSSNKKTKALAFFAFAFYWHKTILLVLPLFLINTTTAKFIFKNKFKVFFFMFFTCISGFPLNFMQVFVETFVPMYSKYVSNEGGYGQGGIELVNLLTKLVYFPVMLFSLLIMEKYKSEIYSNKVELYCCSLWILTYNIFFLFLHTGLIIRLYHLVVFFNIFPIYYVIKYFFDAKKYSMITLLLVALFSIYFLKVAVFPSNEFLYDSIVLR